MKSKMGLAFFSLLWACNDKEEGKGIVCTADIRTSVVVLLSDQNSNPLNEGAMVYYSVDGGADQMAENMNVNGHFYAGEEESGLFRVFAEYRQEDFDGCLWFDATEPVEIEVTANECHVETKELELVLSTDLSDCD